MNAARRSTLGTIALLLTAISVLGAADEESSTLADTSWLSFSLGGILALVTGIAAWLLGRNRGRSADIQAGKIAVGR